MWTWDQSQGKLFDANDNYVCKGYAGYKEGKNNPSKQNTIAIGPIPQGLWRLTGVCNSKNTGPFTIALQPEPGTETFGRNAFRIHGDSIKNPGYASHGCIILPRQFRELIWNSNDHLLKVTE